MAAWLKRNGLNEARGDSVHYAELTANINLLDFKSAGLANFIAAMSGIATSFLAIHPEPVPLVHDFACGG